MTVYPEESLFNLLNLLTICVTIAATVGLASFCFILGGELAQELVNRWFPHDDEDEGEPRT